MINLSQIWPPLGAAAVTTARQPVNESGPALASHPEGCAACPNRSLHGIDFKNPFTMSKREPRSQIAALACGELMSSSLGMSRLVEPIGIEPMT
jgi:hypothetical protein